MAGKIQDRLATMQFQFTAMLNDAGYTADMQAGWLNNSAALEAEEMRNQMQRETTYVTTVTNVYDSMMDQLAALNGQEMDANAKQAALNTIVQGARNLYLIINSLYPDVPSIDFDWPQG